MQGSRPQTPDMRIISWPRRLMVQTIIVVALLALPHPAAADPGVSTTNSWPLAGSIRVIRDFDPPELRWGKGHRGVDLAARIGDPVLAAAGGSVTFAGPVAGRGVVVVSQGATRTTYEPVSTLVAVGTDVSPGTMIGRLTGGSHCRAEPCLHWGLRRGDTYLDPLGLAPRATGQVRLVGQAERAVAQQAAAERAAAAYAAADTATVAMATMSGFVGPTGDHGFSPPVPGGITSAFGMRLHPVRHVWKLHDGTDFGARCGTPIRAPYAGRVASAYFNTGYGNRLLLDHGQVDGRQVVTGYNHATHYVVGVGEAVGQGQVIGYVGSTGYSTGCHLHLMVWLDGGLTNPMVWW